MSNNKKNVKKIVSAIIMTITVIISIYKIIDIRKNARREFEEAQAKIMKIDSENAEKESVQNIVEKAKNQTQEYTINTESTDKTNQTQTMDNSQVEKKSTQINSKVIVIDPGHQTKGNSEKEPIGPGASETKAKVTGGATGVATGKTEYQLNLEVAAKVKELLESRGYTVIMTRTTNNVNISNSERAKIANDAGAAAFIRIHANSVDSSSVRGVLTMCQTSSNKYNGEIANESYKLSKAVLNNFVKSTGATNKGVTRTDTMSGINWCKVPTTIVEMGFMSNPEEDKLMATEDYQNKMAKGIADGVIEYLNS